MNQVNGASAPRSGGVLPGIGTILFLLTGIPLVWGVVQTLFNAVKAFQ